MNNIKPVWFDSLHRNYFFEESTMKPQLCRICFFFSEFYDVKTETSMSWKELFDKQCLLVQYRSCGNT